jgi:pilus assembly protein CpaF
MNSILNLLNQDIELEEILVCEDGISWIDRSGAIHKFEQNGIDIGFVSQLIFDLADKQDVRLDSKLPFGGGRTQIGGGVFRWHAVIPPLSTSGPTLSLRVQRSCHVVSDPSLRAILDEIRLLLENSRLPIYIIGSTGSGKTHLLRAILHEHLFHRRLVIIESTEEIEISTVFWTKLTTKAAGIDARGKIDEDTIVRETLRLRPDTIVFGELRGHELRGYWGLIESGHQVIATIHGQGVGSLNHKLSSALRKSEAQGTRREFHVVDVRRTGSRIEYALHRNQYFIL